MSSYVTAAEYAEMGYSAIPAEELEARLAEASMQVDTLTFNRIVDFATLTAFQRNIIKSVVCKQAEFLYQNADAIASIMDAYSINGVTMHFGTGFNVRIMDGLPIQSTVYSLLVQSGLCCRLAG